MRKSIVITACWTIWSVGNCFAIIESILQLLAISLFLFNYLLYLYRAMIWILQEESCQELWTNSKWYVDLSSIGPFKECIL